MGPSKRRPAHESYKTKKEKAGLQRKESSEVSSMSANGESSSEMHIHPPLGWLKVLAYIIAIIPPCGLVLGIIYYAQPRPENKRFGQYCMLLAGIGLIALCFCWGISGIFRVFRGAEPTGLVGGYF